MSWLRARGGSWPDVGCVLMAEEDDGLWGEMGELLRLTECAPRNRAIGG